MGGSMLAFSATLAGQGLWTEDDRMTLALTVPRSGAQAGPALQGMLLRRGDGSFTFALRPMAAWGAHAASELDLGYSRSLAPNTTLTGAARWPLTGTGLTPRGTAGLQLGLHLSQRF
jgi:hypothetical protein